MNGESARNGEYNLKNPLINPAVQYDTFTTALLCTQKCTSLQHDNFLLAEHFQRVQRNSETTARSVEISIRYNS
jgi:hypothetical protein